MTETAPSSEAMRVEEMLCFAVYSTNFAFNRLYGGLLHDLGLTYPQYLALSVLWTENNRSVGAIARRLFLKTSTVTPLLDRLEALGLVERRPDPADRRAVRVVLTEDGEAMRRRGGCIPAEVCRATGLGMAEMEALGRQLMQLREALCAAADGALPE